MTVSIGGSKRMSQLVIYFYDIQEYDMVVFIRYKNIIAETNTV